MQNPKYNEAVGKGPLHGIPIALKDLVDTAGVRTTAASGLFKDRIKRNLPIAFLRWSTI